MHGPVLQTRRLVLRPMSIEDAPDVFAYASDPDVLRYTTGVIPERLGETEDFLRRVLADPDTRMWAITLREQPRVVGAVEFNLPSPGVGSIHYVLGKPYWGQGLISEAVETVCAWAFDLVPPIDRIETWAVDANIGSARVLEKCGFARVGLVVERWAKEPIPVCLAVFRRERGGIVSALTVDHPTPQPEVNALLRKLVESVQRVLSDRLVGVYLFGSLTSGDFDEDSDVDVLIVTDDEIADYLFSALHAMHDRIAASDSRWATLLEVSYIPRDALRRFDPARALHPHIDRGRGARLRTMQHDADWVVQRHTVRERGITLAGPAPRTLIDPVSPTDLRRAMPPIMAPSSPSERPPIGRSKRWTSGGRPSFSARGLADTTRDLTHRKRT